MVSPSESDIKALVGHKFPGGKYTIAHWENFLLTDCTGIEQLPDGLAHPVALFHVSIMGANTSIDDMFKLGQADSPFSISIESYEWELCSSLLEEHEYTVEGKVTEASRVCDADKVESKEYHGEFYDRIQFLFTLSDEQGNTAARVRITWHYNRGVNEH